MLKTHSCRCNASPDTRNALLWGIGDTRLGPKGGQLYVRPTDTRVSDGGVARPGGRGDEARVPAGPGRRGLSGVFPRETLETLREALRVRTLRGRRWQLDAHPVKRLDPLP